MNPDRSNESSERHDPIRAVERFWGARIPDPFRNLYLHYSTPYIPPCEFFTLEAIAAGAGRAYGQLPQFLPFGRCVGNGGTYGFYLSPETEPGFWPVLYCDDDELFFRPVSSNFESFLRHCIATGRYETTDQYESEQDRESALHELQLTCNTLLLDPAGKYAELLSGRVSRNEAELYQLFANADPTDGYSLCWLGCARRGLGDSDRALDFFHRAVESAQWFGDASYLLADMYRELGKLDRAVQGWWSVVKSLLPLCTRTWEWDLGADHPEAEIYEIAADALSQFSSYASPEMRSSALWTIATTEDPYNPSAREDYGKALMATGNLREAERELLNALSLCADDRGRQSVRIYALLQELYTIQNRDRDRSLVVFDSSLPRPKH